MAFSPYTKLTKPFINRLLTQASTVTLRRGNKSLFVLTRGAQQNVTSLRSLSGSGENNMFKQTLASDEAKDYLNPVFINQSIARTFSQYSGVNNAQQEGGEKSTGKIVTEE